MQSTSHLLSSLAAILVMATLGACATGQSQRQTENTAVGASTAGTSMSGADMRATCADMQQKMMSAKTPAERRAMMQEYMKSMSPEMQQRMHEHMMAMPPEQRQQMHEHMEMMCR